jgi:putative transposase
MARPLRLDYPHTFYHVLSRGNEKREIFRDDKDYLKFLETLGRVVDRFQLEVHAYVLMKNHYHLLVRTRQANLSRAIQWLGVSYSVWFNRKHQRSGHLFQGRFKSFLIENERYFTAMCLYIHNNPLRTGIVKRLAGYKWSSYYAYAHTDRGYQVSWLTTDVVLGIYGGSRREFLKAQRLSFAEEGNLLDDLRHGLYLGSAAFSEECIQRGKGEEHREKPQFRSLLRDKNIGTLAVEILERLGEKEPDSMLNSGRRRRPNRDLAVYILYQLGVYRNDEIGEVFKVRYTAISGAVKRAQQYLSSHTQLEKMIRKTINDI